MNNPAPGCSPAPFFPLKPRQGGLFISKAVHKLEANRLSARENTAIGHLCQLAVVHSASILHQAFEPAVGIEDDRFDCGPRFGASWLESIGRGLQRRGFHLFDLDTDCFEHIGKIRILKEHPDRTDQRRLLRYNVLSRERGDIGAGCGKSVDNDDHGLLALQFTQGVVKLLGTGCRSTGTINVDDHGARGRASKTGQCLDAILIRAD